MLLWAYYGLVTVTVQSLEGRQFYKRHLEQTNKQTKEIIHFLLLLTPQITVAAQKSKSALLFWPAAGGEVVSL